MLVECRQAFKPEGKGHFRREKRLRVLSLGFLLISALLVQSCKEEPETQNLHNRAPEMERRIDLKIKALNPALEPSSMVAVGAEAVNINPDVFPTEIPQVVIPSVMVEAASSGEVRLIPESFPVTKQVAQSPVGGQQQPVLISFYYCERTIDKSDDGGKFCYGTAHAGLVHPGTAACSNAWVGRSFVIVDNTLDQVYTCEDSGLLQENQVDIWFATNGEGWSWPHLGEGSIIWQN